MSVSVPYTTLVCGFCGKENENTEFHADRYSYSPCHDDIFCDTCSMDTVAECDLCKLNQSLKNYSDSNYILNSTSIRKLKEMHPHIKIICTRCVSYIYIACRKCENVFYTDISKIYTLENIDIEYIHDMLKDLYEETIEEDFGVYDGDCYCSECFQTIVRSIATHPPNRMNSELYRYSETFDVCNIKRFVGIESEAIYHDIPIEECDYEEYIDVPMGWQAVYDGSLSEGGVELKTSRPIQGDLIHSRVKGLVQSYEYEDAYIDISCGLHIHFNAIDLNTQDMKNIIYIIKGIESTILDSMIKNRKDNRYCRTLNRLKYIDLDRVKNLSDLCKLWYNNLTYSDERMTMSHYNNSRYHGLNLHSRFYMGTIEFRYHEGTMDYEDIMDWIYFCRNIINSARIMSNDKLSRQGRKYRNKLIETFVKDKGIKTTPLERIHLIGGKDSAQYIERRINKQINK